MILPREQIRRVLQGRKTEARVPTTYAELAPDRVVPVQPDMRAPAACRVRIVAIAVEQLADITPKGAWHEGFRTRDHFFAWFEARFGSAELVYVRRFTLINVDPPRLLAKQNGYYEPQQYVAAESGALPHEPEAVPAADQAWITLEAGQAGIVQRSTLAELRRQRWSLSQRLARLELQGTTASFTSEMRLIEKKIERMENP